MSSEVLAASRLERRTNLRFPLALNLRYLQSNSSWAEGRVLDISSRGILFQGDGALPVGRVTEVVVTWPFLLNGECPLQLRVRGRILRSGPEGTALKISRYEFRTAAKVPAQAKAPSAQLDACAVPVLSSLFGQTVR